MHVSPHIDPSFRTTKPVVPDFRSHNKRYTEHTALSQPQLSSSNSTPPTLTNNMHSWLAARQKQHALADTNQQVRCSISHDVIPLRLHR